MNEINWSDKQQVLKAVNKSGNALKYASEELKNDKDVVLTAVKENGLALKYASEELKNDKEIVLASVNSNGYSLKFASEELKNDKEVVLAAVNQNGYSLKFVSNQLQNDLGLLKLLKNYHMDNDINKYGEEYKTWYTERMTVLDILNQQELLEKNIPNNSGKSKTRKF